MTDIFTKSKRSQIMAKVRSKNTKPELLVRKELFAQGIRYRLHRDDLPGKPDLCLSKYKAVIFIHGCQWHWHGCSRSRMPSSNVEYWKSKISRNIIRDKNNIVALINLGWRVLIVWECTLKRPLMHGTINATLEWLHNENMRCNQIEPLSKEEVQINSLQMLS